MLRDLRPAPTPCDGLTRRDLLRAAAAGLAGFAAFKALASS
jgi:hypothetical protein